MLNSLSVTNKFFLYLLFGFCISCINPKEKKQNVENKFELETNPNELKEQALDFEKFNNQIRDGELLQVEAIKKIKEKIAEIKIEYYNFKVKNWNEDSWVFPIEGYNFTAIGGSNGDGYIPYNYNYFDGNKHGGHPAHDIFIYDKNQDCKDDKTNQFVNVLSLSGGVVLATEKNWDKSSKLRGGNYIWVFDPTSNSLFYYAHNDKVLVSSGDVIFPGKIISTVGRSGLNAYKKRSPTHLHFSQLQFNSNFFPTPANTYKKLIKATTK